MSTEAQETRVAPPEANAPFGVYVHWPFCAAKCPYCDFNSHVRHGGIDEDRFLAAYLTELSYFSHEAPGRTVSSVFFGGGTPSLMSPRMTGAILDAIARHWTLDTGAEITLEANPSSVEAEKFAGYAAAGVNRLSLGVQALDDARVTIDQFPDLLHRPPLPFPTGLRQIDQDRGVQAGHYRFLCEGLCRLRTCCSTASMAAWLMET